MIGIQSRQQEIETAFRELPRKYENEFTVTARVVGSVVFAFIALELIACAVQISNHPYAFTNLTNVAAGLGIATILISGTAYVIQRALKKEDSLNEPVLEPAVIHLSKKKNHWFKAYVNKATLKNGTGTAYLYAAKTVENHYLVSTLAAFATPFIGAAAVAFHTIKMCVVPFYVLVCLAVEQCVVRCTKKKSLFKGQRQFKCIDILIKPAKSLEHIVRAPFYTLALFAAILFSLVKPIHGQILGGNIERDWNCSVDLEHGYWSIEGRGALWAGWGMLGPEKLELLGFFLLGCWQKVWEVEYKDGVIVDDRCLIISALEKEIFFASQLPNGKEYKRNQPLLNGLKR